MNKPSFAQVVKSPGFKFIWVNQILVQLAYNCVNFALVIWVFQLTNSNLSVSVLMLSILVPTILFGLMAGVLVDISDRRKIIISVDLLLVLLYLALFFLKDTFWVIIILSFLVNAAFQFFIPAEGSSVPLLVSKNKLLLANSLFQLTSFGSILLGYSLAGPIINFFSLNSLFLMAAGLISIGLVVSSYLPTIVSKNGAKEMRLASALVKLEVKKSSKLIWDQVVETFRFIKGKLPIAVAIGILAGVQGVVGTLAVLIPAYMEKVLHIHATDASYVVMFPLGLGMVTGALLIGRFGTGVPKRILVTRGVLVGGLVLFLVGIAPLIGQAFNHLELTGRILKPRSFFHTPSLSTFLFVFAFILGLANVMVFAPSQTVLQEYTPESSRGKIFSVLAVFMSTFAALPVILAGGLADIFGVLPVFITSGILIILLGLLGSRPGLFFAEHHLPANWREFLGIGH